MGVLRTILLVGASSGLFFCAPLVAEPSASDLSILTGRGKQDIQKFPIPDFTKGGKPHETHDWNLGPTGLRGWMWGMQLQTDLARQILITKVEEKSPAHGKLKVGDVILGVSGTGLAKPFSSDARIAFGNAITEAEKVKNKGYLSLLV